MRIRLSALAVPAILATVLAVLVPGIASAQYPTVVGNVTCSGSSTIPQAASNVTISAKFADATGKPLVGTLVDFKISSQPGNSARLSSSTAVTDQSGMATVSLATGSTPGLVTVQCLAAGGTGSQFVAEVAGSNSIEPSRTGDGGLVGSQNGASSSRTSSSSSPQDVLPFVFMAAAVVSVGFAIRHKLAVRNR